MNYKVKLGIWGQDAGDGSYTTRLFASKKVADEAREAYAKEADLDLDDTYETGCTDEETFEFELIDGKLILVNEPSVNMGQ